MRLRLFSSLSLLAAGCVEDVPIAAECPPDDPGPCIVEFDGGNAIRPQPDAASARADAALPPPSIVGRDAGAGYVLPPFQNLSFEFSTADSMAGDVTAVSSITSTTSIHPWYTCQPIGGSTGNSVTAVRAETGLSAGTTESSPKADVAPSDGKVFITVGYLVNIVNMPLVQRLRTPLQANTRYAFAIDALATSPAAELSLEIRANEQGCLGSSQSLFNSSPVTTSSWMTLCVSFSAPEDLTYVALAANTDSATSVLEATNLLGGDPLGGPRLVLDNIREATAKECPQLF